MSDIAIILLILLGFEAKHFLGDFVLQSPYTLQNRRFYGHPGGLLHAGIHVGLSAVVLLAAGTSAPLLAGLLLFEGLVHYHLDWAKDRFVHKRDITPQTHAYWVILGADQLLHQITYLAMVWVWAGVMLSHAA